MVIARFVYIASVETYSSGCVFVSLCLCVKYKFFQMSGKFPSNERKERLKVNIIIPEYILYFDNT